MEVLKRGITAKDWFDKVICSPCQSLLRIRANDLITIAEPHERKYYYYCAVCGSRERYETPLPELVKRYILINQSERH